MRLYENIQHAKSFVRLINTENFPHLLSFTTSAIQQGSSNAFNDRPSTSATSTGIEILEDIVLRPSTLNSTADEIVTDFDETQMDTLRLNGLNIISEAPQLLNGM